MKLSLAAVLLGSMAMASCTGSSGGGGRATPDAGTPSADAVTSADATVPDIAIPDAVMPDSVIPDIALPDAAGSDAAVPDIAMPDAVMPDVVVPDVSVPDAAGPDVIRDLANPDLSVPGDASMPTPDAGSGAMPRFVDPPDAGGSKQLLTCIAHLYGKTIAGVPLHPIAAVSVTNPGSAPADVIVTAQLQNYSDKSSVGLHVPASGTASTPPIDLSLHLSDLYTISAPVTANVTLELALAGNAALLDAHSKSIAILPKNTIYWSMPDSTGNQVDTRFFIGAFVTPHDQALSVDQLLKDAASYSRFNQMIGYQYTSILNQSSVSSLSAVAPGQCSTKSLALHAGPLSISAAASCSSLCASSNAYVQIYTQAALAGSGAPLGEIDGLGSWSGTLNVPADDTYVFAGCNPSANSTNRDFTITLAPTAATGAFDQMGAIFLALKARGLQYVTVAQDFFASAQNVKYPVESLATTSANCIDGTLVFASALESMGMRPGIIMFSDHATIAVLADPSADPCTIANWFPMETTMVSSNTPMEAVTYDVKNHMSDVVQVFASECSGVTPNVPTIFDVKSLRDLGITPASM